MQSWDKQDYTDLISFGGGEKGVGVGGTGKND